jgi:hypothetical protein
MDEYRDIEGIVVFTRIEFSKGATSKEIAWAIETLAQIQHQMITLDESEIRCHTTINGAFVLLLPQDPTAAVEWAVQLREQAVNAGLTVSIGIDSGHLTVVSDLGGKNLLGPTINYAARLASMSRNYGRIAISLRLSPDLSEKNRYTVQLTENVKQTSLEFKWYATPLVRSSSVPLKKHNANAEHYYALVYDIEGYSGLSEDEQPQYAKELTDITRETLVKHWLTLENDKRIGFVPTGDGGAFVVTTDGLTVLNIFIRDFCNRVSKTKLRVRFTLASGTAVRISPSGVGGEVLLKADVDAGKPDAGCVYMTEEVKRSLDKIGQLSLWSIIPLSDGGYVAAPDGNTPKPRQKSASPLTSSKIDDGWPGESEWMVVQSDAARTGGLTLEGFVREAQAFLPYKDKISVLFASDSVRSLFHFKAALRAMFSARVVFFDLRHFEPVVMLLLGVRAVARRRGTILSLGETGYVLGENIVIPYDIRDANFICHSDAQNSSAQRPHMLIVERLTAEDSTKSVHFQPLGVFEAIRLIPHGNIPEILVLCPHGSDEYRKRIWTPKKLLGGLKYGNKFVATPSEMRSPWRVSQAMYIAIRRAGKCVCDWTEWNPNVFFELGVRLVTNPLGTTVCAIEALEIHKTRVLAGQEPKDLRAQAIAGQCLELLNLFMHEIYDGERTYHDYLKEPENDPYKRMREQDGSCDPCRIGANTWELFDVIEQAATIDEEPAGVPLYRELYEASESYRKNTSTSEPVTLFPKFSVNADKARIDRLVAAYKLLLESHSEDSLLEPGPLRNDARNIIRALLELKDSINEHTSKHFLEELDHLWQKIGLDN